MGNVPSLPCSRKRAMQGALTGAVGSHPCARSAHNVGGRNGALTRRYDAGGSAHGRAATWHETGLNCITVGLNDWLQGVREPGEDTVGSPKQAAPVQADTGSKNVAAQQVHRSRVVRADRPILGSYQST